MNDKLATYGTEEKTVELESETEGELERAGGSSCLILNTVV
jgi:hypothetical protein